MRKTLSLLLALPVVLLSTACATKSVDVTRFDAKIHKVSSIALVDDMVGDDLQTLNQARSHSRWGDAGAAVNAIPGPGAIALTGLANVVAGKMMRNDQDKVNDNRLRSLMEPTALDAEARFQSALKQKLDLAGFTDGGMIGSQRPERELLEDYPDANADAILDINILRFGAIKRSHDFELGWQPWSIVQVRMISAKDKSVIMENQVSYNHGYPINKGKTVRLFSYDGAKAFNTLAEIDADAMSKDMDIMIDEVTDAIISLLGKTTP